MNMDWINQVIDEFEKGKKDKDGKSEQNSREEIIRAARQAMGLICNRAEEACQYIEQKGYPCIINYERGEESCSDVPSSVKSTDDVTKCILFISPDQEGEEGSGEICFYSISFHYAYDFKSIIVTEQSKEKGSYPEFSMKSTHLITERYIDRKIRKFVTKIFA